MLNMIKGFFFAVFAAFVIAMFPETDVQTDVAKYDQCMSFGNIAQDSKWHKCGMDESIWPAQVTEDMDVSEFKMIYYNPWDPQYLGYMVVNYDTDDYEKEVERLKNYKSTDYIGYYGVRQEETYDLLAVYSDDYHGFVYALTDGENRIIYAEQIFCNYYMDINYKKEIPSEYLLDGFDATSDNQYRKVLMKR